MEYPNPITPAAVYIRQPNQWTCGPVALKMALALQQIDHTLEELVLALKTTEQEGTSHGSLVRFAQQHAFEHEAGGDTSLRRVRQWLKEGYTVVVAYFDTAEQFGHFAVITAVTDRRVHLLDPWFGPEHSYSISHFYKIWHDTEGYRRWAMAIRN